MMAMMRPHVVFYDDELIVLSQLFSIDYFYDSWLRFHFYFDAKI